MLPVCGAKVAMKYERGRSLSCDDIARSEG